MYGDDQFGGGGFDGGGQFGGDNFGGAAGVRAALAPWRVSARSGC